MIKISVTKLETSRFVAIEQLLGKTFTISIVDWYCHIFKVTSHFVVIFKHQEKDLVYVLCIRTEVYPKRLIYLSLQFSQYNGTEHASEDTGLWSYVSCGYHVTR